MTESAAAAEPARTLELNFTGSGSEYFRIWAVNLLLIVLSLGLYLPFAKARRIRYVYANTLVDGQALSFHGKPWKMFRGFVLLVVLMGSYTLAGEFAPSAALPLLALLYAVWPALWRASMQFRLGNTSWRGLRTRFEGSLKDAYLAFAPAYVPISLLLLLSTEFASHGPSNDRGINDMLGTLLTTAALVLLAPWSLALAKRYQHRGYRIAGERGQLTLAVRSVYFIGFKGLMLGFVGLLAVVFGGFLLGALLALLNSGRIDAPGNGTYFSLAFLALGYAVLGSVVAPYLTTRLQNLVWSNTSSDSLRFRSELEGWTLVWLTLKNWLLILLTLGLYRPFAVIDTLRLRLQAVRVQSASAPEGWQAPAQTFATDASGEIAGDFFGVDMGL